MQRSMRGLAVASAIVCITVFAITAMSRLRIPGPLTDVRFGTVQQVQRVLDRQPLYPPASAAFVPLVYPPLYSYLSAGVAAATGVGYLPLRLTSLLATFSALAVIVIWVRRDTGEWPAAIVAAGLFAATYRATGAWFDAERVDAVFVAFLLSGLLVLWRADTRRAVAGGALLLLLAGLSKQPGFLIGGVLTIHMALRNRRDVLTFGGVLFGGGAVAALLLNWREGGGYTFYVYQLASRGLGTPLVDGRFVDTTVWFAAKDLAGTFGIALTAGSLLLAGRAGDTPSRIAFLRWAAIAVILAAYSSRAVHGSRENALMPVYALAAIVFGCSVPSIRSMLHAADRSSAWVWAAATAQMVSLAYVPWHLREPLLERSSEPIAIIAGPARPPRRSEPDGQSRFAYADPTAAAEFLLGAPPAATTAFVEALQRDVCASSDAHPLIVGAYLFDPDWRASLRPTADAPVPLPSWDELARQCQATRSSQ